MYDDIWKTAREEAWAMGCEVDDEPLPDCETCGETMILEPGCPLVCANMCEAHPDEHLDDEGVCEKCEADEPDLPAGSMLALHLALEAAHRELERVNKAMDKLPQAWLTDKFFEGVNLGAVQDTVSELAEMQRRVAKVAFCEEQP